MRNYLSIDFESWAYPELPEFLSLTSEQRKKVDNGYVKESAEAILEILDKHKTKITFFIIGQLYEWYPEIIVMIEHEGHEIGYHTHTHNLLKSETVLRESLEQSKAFIQRFKPIGFRAPAISIEESYLKILSEHGFLYDSSFYGLYQTKRSIEKVMEFPVSTISRIPIGSGYFIGLMGNNIAFFYRRINKQVPVIAFIHNWQIVKPKKVSFPTKTYLFSHPHYFPYTLEVRKTFEFLLENFEFAPMRTLLD